MIFYKHKNFLRNYSKLPKKLQQKVDETLLIFEENPSTPKLKNHALKGKLLPMRSINVTEDIRILFQEKENYTIIYLLQLGTHSQLY